MKVLHLGIVSWRKNDCLMESYGFGKFVEDKPFEGNTELKSEDYPDYYGGSYIDESGQLVICVAGSLDNGKEELDDILPSGNYIIRHVKNAYCDMTSILENIDTLFFDENNDVTNNIAAYGIAEKENNIFVELIEFNDKAIEFFNTNIIKSDIIEFRQGSVLEGESQLRLIVQAGGGVTRPDGTGRSSIGFRARRNGINGFVMSGHGAGSQLNRAVRLSPDNLTVGNITARRRSGSVDASFCRADSSAVNLTNRILQNNFVLGAVRATASVGASIAQAGIGSRVTTGTVLARGVRVSANADGLTVAMTDMARASYTSAGGDSGGPVYRVSGSQRHILGVHVGALGSNRYYSQIFNIESAIGAIAY